MEEIWRDIDGYEGLYQISNLGRVKSLDRYIVSRWGTPFCLKGKIRRLRKDKYGYMCLSLNKDGKIRYKTIHRLVAQAFIPNPNNLPQVNHKDEDKTNNCVENLEWCDGEYNLNYGNRKKKAAISRYKPINQYDLFGNLIKTWKSASTVQEELGFKACNICWACRGKIKTAYGFKWSYAIL